jgi:hypothetical protein
MFGQCQKTGVKHRVIGIFWYFSSKQLPIKIEFTEEVKL